jgi:hypothetical protein
MEGDRVWRRPELVVLVRTAPEEAVLGACKQEAHPVGFPHFNHHQCAGFLIAPCILCTLVGSS